LVISQKITIFAENFLRTKVYEDAPQYAMAAIYSSIPDGTPSVGTGAAVQRLG
jgi:hypothetical protein